jgi:hypothetical protein
MTTTTTRIPTTNTDATQRFTDADTGTGRRGRRIGVAVGAVLATCAIGIVAINTGDDRPERPVPARQEQLPEIARWADTHGLTGLSPASLSAIDPTPGFEARRADVQAAIAEAAIAEGLSGLSPASLRPTSD